MQETQELQNIKNTETSNVDDSWVDEIEILEIPKPEYNYPEDMKKHVEQNIPLPYTIDDVDKRVPFLMDLQKDVCFVNERIFEEKEGAFEEYEAKRDIYVENFKELYRQVRDDWVKYDNPDDNPWKSDLIDIYQDDWHSYEHIKSNYTQHFKIDYTKDFKHVDFLTEDFEKDPMKFFLNLANTNKELYDKKMREYQYRNRARYWKLSYEEFLQLDRYDTRRNNYPKPENTDCGYDRDYMNIPRPPEGVTYPVGNNYIYLWCNYNLLDLEREMAFHNHMPKLPSLNIEDWKFDKMGRDGVENDFFNRRIPDFTPQGLIDAVLFKYPFQDGNWNGLRYEPSGKELDYYGYFTPRQADLEFKKRSDLVMVSHYQDEKDLRDLCEKYKIDGIALDWNKDLIKRLVASLEMGLIKEINDDTIFDVEHKIIDPFPPVLTEEDKLRIQQEKLEQERIAEEITKDALERAKKRDEEAKYKILQNQLYSERVQWWRKWNDLQKMVNPNVQNYINTEGDDWADGTHEAGIENYKNLIYTYKDRIIERYLRVNNLLDKSEQEKQEIINSKFQLSNEQQEKFDLYCKNRDYLEKGADVRDFELDEDYSESGAGEVHQLTLEEFNALVKIEQQKKERENAQLQLNKGVQMENTQNPQTNNTHDLSDETLDSLLKALEGLDTPSSSVVTESNIIDVDTIDEPPTIPVKHIQEPQNVTKSNTMSEQPKYVNQHEPLQAIVDTPDNSIKETLLNENKESIEKVEEPYKPKYTQQELDKVEIPDTPQECDKPLPKNKSDYTFYDFDIIEKTEREFAEKWLDLEDEMKSVKERMKLLKKEYEDKSINPQSVIKALKAVEKRYKKTSDEIEEEARVYSHLSKDKSILLRISGKISDRKKNQLACDDKSVEGIMANNECKNVGRQKELWNFINDDRHNFIMDS